MSDLTTLTTTGTRCRSLFQAARRRLAILRRSASGGMGCFAARLPARRPAVCSTQVARCAAP